MYTRPIFNTEMAIGLADSIGQQVFEWCNGETPLVDCIADIKDILQEPCNDNGYELARELGCRGYCPDLELVEILERVQCQKDAVLTKAIKKWVIDNKIEPKFQIGDTIIAKCGGARLVGEITGICKDTAEYLVCIPSKGMTIEGTLRAIVKYENTQSSDMTGEAKL